MERYLPLGLLYIIPNGLHLCGVINVLLHLNILEDLANSAYVVGFLLELPSIGVWMLGSAFHM